ncbi:A24 family peptidase [Pannonibacter tanglangensis]|uniref:A24 family peptidase n=1 Tax=Pannonibacter tanglangensis TaxID=2750084 RepID=UPI001FCA9D5A|nr:prepilin peptidase [Pannonibacter sp. XCT-34]
MLDLSMLEAAILVIFPTLVAFAAASDFLTMTIPNRVSLLLVGCFVVMAAAVGMPLEQVGWHLLAGALVLTVTFGMFAAGWMGGGDAKVASAIALWIGFNINLLYFAALTSAYGLLVIFAMIAFRQMPYLPAPLARQEWALRFHDYRTGIPYGIAIAAGALHVYPMTAWFAPLAN